MFPFVFLAIALWADSLGVCLFIEKALMRRSLSLAGIDKALMQLHLCTKETIEMESLHRTQKCYTGHSLVYSLVSSPGPYKGYSCCSLWKFKRSLNTLPAWFQFYIFFFIIIMILLGESIGTWWFPLEFCQTHLCLLWQYIILSVSTHMPCGIWTISKLHRQEERDMDMPVAHESGRGGQGCPRRDGGQCKTRRWEGNRSRHSPSCLGPPHGSPDQRGTSSDVATSTTSPETRGEISPRGTPGPRALQHGSIPRWSWSSGDSPRTRACSFSPLWIGRAGLRKGRVSTRKMEGEEDNQMVVGSQKVAALTSLRQVRDRGLDASHESLFAE